MKKTLRCCLILISLVLAASRSTIPELYKLNSGYPTSDYSTTYKNSALSTEFGVSSEAGDINNDEIPDFMISDPLYENKRGIVYVIYGKQGSLRQFNSMGDFQPSDGFIIKGPTDGQRFGFSVATAGDVNNDGIDDIIIGSRYWTDNQLPHEVTVAYVLFGRKSSTEFPNVIDVDRLSSTQGFRIFGTMEPGGYSGFTVSRAGDVNGDGISDIMIGALATGNTYIIYGTKGLTDMKVSSGASKGFTILGSWFDHFGESISPIGDFNGDGVDDIIIGAPVAADRKGQAWIIYGKKGGFLASINPSRMNESDRMLIQGINQGDSLGCGVSGAGDLNGDGLQDVIVGAEHANYGSGVAYVIYGSRQTLDVLNVNSLNPTRGFNVMTNASGYPQLGLYVGGGRDINGDGRSDVIIGAPGRERETGAVYVIYGNTTMTNILLENLQPNQGFAMFGKEMLSRYGDYVRMLKDINGDGLDDFIVGAPKGNAGKGSAYLFYLPWSCPDKCKKCNGPNICTDWVCIDKCTKCSSATTCDVWRCPENCTPCKKPDFCEACISGFAFIDDKCEVCSNSETHFIQNGYCFEILDKWGPIKSFFGGIFG